MLPHGATGHSKGSPGHLLRDYLLFQTSFFASALGERVAELLAKEAGGWQLMKQDCGVCSRGLE